MADNVVVVHVNSADVTGESVDAVQTDKGKVFVGAQCKYTGIVTGGLRIYRVPDLLVVKLIELHGSQSQSEPARGRNCEPRGDSAVLKRRAGESAIEAAQASLKNLFAPKGYLLERRRCGRDDVFKVSIGKSGGLDAGDLVDIYTLHLAVNPLTGVGDLEEEKVANGCVSTRVGSNHAWIAGLKSADVSRVHLGDYIQVVYKPPFSVKVREWIRGLFGRRE